MDSRLDSRRRKLAAIGSALLLSAVYLQASIAWGRLRFDITYDDIAYVCDASGRLETLASRGPWRFLVGLVRDPPHSPFSTLLAGGALLVGGYHDIVFYVANGLLLVAAALFLARSFERAPAGALAWVLAAFLFAPLCYQAIENFRPDIALGFATAAMAWWFLRGTLDADAAPLRWAGVAAGAALLIKPSFFAHTLALMAGLVLIHFIVRRWGPAPDRAPDDGGWPALAQFLGLALLLSLPYALLAGRSMIDYLWTNTHGKDAYLWSFPPGDSAWQVARSFLLDGYQKGAGWHLVLAAALIVAGALHFWRSGRRRDLALLVGLVAIALESFLILVVGRHKNEYFFAAFQCLLLLAAFHGFVALCDAGGVRMRRGVLALGWSALALAVLGNYRTETPDPGAETRTNRSWNARVASWISESMESHANPARLGRPPLQVLVTVPGPVNAYAVVWEARKMGVQGLLPMDVDRIADLPEIQGRIREAAFVIVPSSTRAVFFRNFPVVEFQDRIARDLAADPQFERISPAEADAHYVLFQNRAFAPDRVPVMQVPALSTVEGFLNEEGPYPQWQLPRVQWMTAAVGRICGLEPGRYEVQLQFHGSAPGVLHVTGPHGDELAATPFDAERFVDLGFAHRYGAEGQPCLELRPVFASPSKPAHTLLFRRLRFARVGD
jgi:hypothetical protein